MKTLNKKVDTIEYQVNEIITKIYESYGWFTEDYIDNTVEIETNISLDAFYRGLLPLIAEGRVEVMHYEDVKNQDLVADMEDLAECFNPTELIYIVNW